MKYFSKNIEPPGGEPPKIDANTLQSFSDTRTNVGFDR